MSGDAVSIRIAQAGDVEVVRTLTRDAYAKWIPRIGREPRPMVADYDTAIATHRIDLATIDDDIVALVEMIPTTASFVIENIAVLPLCQGRGLGHRMLSHAESIAADMGYRTVFLYTNKLFVENLRFYDRRGYRVDREEVWAGSTIVHLSKPVGVGAAPGSADGG